MSAQLRTLRKRIRSVESTKKITRAMEMVSAAKLQRYQNMMISLQPFTAGLETLVRRLVRLEPDTAKRRDDPKKPQGLFHPLLETRPENKVLIVVITSDTGLCGSFNMDLVSVAEQFAATFTKDQTLIWAGVGKTGVHALRRQGREFLKTFTEIRTQRVEPVLAELETLLRESFLSGAADSVYAVYSHRLSATAFEGVPEKILPLRQPENSMNEPLAARLTTKDIFFEPDPARVFETLIPLYFKAKLRTIFLESLVSEQMARMQAMHLATENAEEMIDRLVLLRNKARQTAITKELIEIVTGAKALKLN